MKISLVLTIVMAIVLLCTPMPYLGIPLLIVAWRLNDQLMFIRTMADMDRPE